MKAIQIFFIAFLLTTFTSNDLSAKVIDGELIIQLKQKVDGEHFVEQFKNEYQTPTLKLVKRFSKKYRLFLLSFDPQLENQAALIAALKQQKQVQLVSINSQASLREERPNDPLFDNQVDLELINAPEVWEFTKGGTTALGHEIVVANLESSVHEDIEENYWYNEGEFPSDGLDNDENGYVDDYLGVNITENNDYHPSSNHGTSVGGIIAAKGNNNLGVTGVNWDVKLMIVTSRLTKAEIMEGLTYVYDMRKKYNDSGGNAGAFVVAINTSFGFDNQKVEDDPLNEIWCQLYEDLGAVGILSSSATNNTLNTNIDLVGDMPTTCPSDFLIGVTDSNTEDQLEAAIGPIHVDLSAPGTGTFTVETTNDYGIFTSTSAAAPHVAGGIALLYSLPCEKLAQAAIDQPEATALLMKDFILNGVKKLDALEGKMVAGGRLDLKGSMNLITEYCDGVPEGPLEITSLTPNLLRAGMVLSAKFQTPDRNKYTIQVFDAIGQLLQKEEITIPTFEAFEYKVKTNNFAPGVYILSIENINDIQTKKFVIY